MFIRKAELQIETRLEIAQGDLGKQQGLQFTMGSKSMWILKKVKFRSSLKPIKFEKNSLLLLKLLSNVKTKWSTLRILCLSFFF